MSSYVPFSEEAKSTWIKYIKDLLDVLYSNGNLMLLGQIISQIYEFTVWCAPRTIERAFNVKDLHLYSEDTEFVTMCNQLSRIRHVAVHQPFSLTKSTSSISLLLSDINFKDLLRYAFDDASMFDEMLSTYSRWLYE